jgi:hypothetical protein
MFWAWSNHPRKTGVTFMARRDVQMPPKVRNVLAWFAAFAVLVAVTKAITSDDPVGDGIPILITTWFSTFASLILYFVPLLVAAHREHRRILAIGALNFFTGWTIIGWIAALVWARKTPAPVVAIHSSEPRSHQTH